MIYKSKNYLTALDDWNRMMCIKMPISEKDSAICITPDGEFENCKHCRYYVTHNYRR